MKNCTASQGQRLASLLKQRPHTYGDMQQYGISTSPQKRLREWEKLNPDWKIDVTKRRDGLVAWRVVKAQSK